MLFIPEVRSPYNYDRDAVSDETGLRCEDESLAQQSFREESDINYILRRFNVTGELPAGVSVPQYGDFTEVHDYHSALSLVRDADRAFMLLPAHVRSRFDNDAGAFVDFVSNPDNLDECVSMGLAVKKTNLDQQAQPVGEEASPQDAAV